MKIGKEKRRVLTMLCIAVAIAALLAAADGYFRATSASKNAETPSISSASNKEIEEVKLPAVTTTPTPRPAPQPTGSNAFVTRTFTNSQGLSLTYYLYVPYNYTPLHRYPLVLLLHGGGERSNPDWTAAEKKAVLFNQPYVQVWTPGYSVPYGPHIQQRWPCFVVIPQLSYGQYWVNAPVGGGSYIQTPQPTPWLLMAKEIVDSLQKEYMGIDPGRLYITGLSLGGYGVWDAIERWPTYFAAAIPIAGAGDPSKAAAIKNLPIWAFQGSADTVVPVSGSRDMISALDAASGHPRYTEYPGAGHTVWGYVYGTTGTNQNTPGVMSWLFSRKQLEPPYLPPRFVP